MYYAYDKMGVVLYLPMGVDMGLPPVLEAALEEARVTHASAETAYSDLARLVRLENRRRLGVLHGILRAKNLGYCSGCNSFKPRSSLELRFWPKWQGADTGRIYAVCGRCQATRFARDYVRPAQLTDAGFAAQDDSGSWQIVNAGNARGGDWAFLPRQRVTPKMAKRFGIQESIRLPRHCRPGARPELTAFAQ